LEVDGRLVARGVPPNVLPVSSLQLPVEISQLPDWAIPAIGGGFAVVVLTLGYLIFGRRQPPERPPSWHDGRPTLRTYERQIQRNNEAPRGSDQRSSLRRTGNPVDVQITDAEAKEPATSALVIDRSLRGLCLAVDYPRTVGAIINVRPLSGATTLPWIRLRVKNCRYVGNAYELGCEFLQVPPSSILMLFG
jgi:hypothetical protein